MRIKQSVQHPVYSEKCTKATSKECTQDKQRCQRKRSGAPKGGWGEDSPSCVIKSLSLTLNTKYSPSLPFFPSTGTSAILSHFSFNKPASWLPPLRNPNFASSLLTLKSRKLQYVAAVIPASSSPSEEAMEPSGALLKSGDAIFVAEDISKMSMWRYWLSLLSCPRPKPESRLRIRNCVGVR